MRNFRATITGISVLFTAAILAMATDRPPDMENFGLSGPVHTVTSTVEELAPGPRNRQLISLWTACGNCSFDRRGYSISRAQISNGVVEKAHLETDVDAQGWPTEDRTYGDDGKLLTRNTYHNGPYGPLAGESWSGDHEISRFQYIYDEHGHTIVSRTWVEGELSSELFTRRGEHGEEEQIFRFPQSNEEDIQTTTYTDNGDRSAMERRRNGELVMRATFDGEQLTSWFMSKDANFSIGFGTNSPEAGFTANFSSDPETGRLVREEYVHPGRKGNIDSDEVRRYDTAGTLIEKVTFDYNRDSFGNWTRRTAYVWDLTTGTRTALQRITRVISYY
jgi:hypothetical protein